MPRFFEVFKLLRSDFNFDLPLELIANYPSEKRTACRMLCLDGNSGDYQDKHFYDLKSFFFSFYSTKKQVVFSPALVLLLILVNQCLITQSLYLSVCLSVFSFLSPVNIFSLSFLHFLCACFFKKNNDYSLATLSYYKNDIII